MAYTSAGIPYLNRLYRHARDIIDYLRAFQQKEYTSLQVLKVETSGQLLAAKKLHAKVYVDRGFVDARHLNNDAILDSKADPYQHHSVYFLVASKKNGEVVATARQIYATPRLGNQSFPLLKHTDLYARALRAVSRHDANKCVEISGLAKKRGASKIAPLLLYRALWHYSLQQKHSLWLLTCDVRLFERLKLLFGPAIQRVGRTTFYLGSDVVPAILKVQSSVSELRHSLAVAPPVTRRFRLKVVGFLLRGIPIGALSPQEKRALDDIKKRYHIAP